MDLLLGFSYPVGVDYALKSKRITLQSLYKSGVRNLHSKENGDMISRENGEEMIGI